MTTIEAGWQAYMAAVARAQEKHASGAGAEVLRDVLDHARTLLAGIDDELASSRSEMPDDARRELEQLRAELVEFAAAPVTRH